MTFDPFKVQIYRESGTANMAARICRPKGFVLVSVRCKFTSGTGSADMTLVSYASPNGETLATLLTIPGVGTTGEASVNVPFAVSEIDAGAWTVLPGEILQCNWTNPNSGTMAWSLEVRYQIPNA